VVDPRRPRGRPYRGDDDLVGLLRFLRAVRATDPEADVEHVGDLLWALRDPGFDRISGVRLWTDATGEIVGYARAGAGEFRLQSALSPGGGELAGEMLEWAIGRCGPEMVPTTGVRERNSAMGRFLRERGFERGDRWYDILLRSIDDPIPSPGLPAGFRLRDGPVEAEFEEYSTMHRTAWGSGSTYSPEVHRAVAESPGYRRSLNPSVVDPLGAFAGACIVWLDVANRIGEIEPLQVAPPFRRRGLARAVVVEGLRRMRRTGMRSALVYGVDRNEAARRLYASLGFRPVDRVYEYRKSSA